MRRLAAGILATVLVIGGIVWSLAPAALPAGTTQASQDSSNQASQGSGESATDAVVLHKFVGTASCTAANCHGGDGTRGVSHESYSIWIQRDPHARSYSLLFDPRSKQMATQLKLSQPAHQARECLACHATGGDRSARHNREAMISDGVGCESCHGPAKDWLGPHVRRDWLTRSHSDKESLGFRNTKDILIRARLCVECHVGAPGRDVNHDLIAAGHPALRFELAAHHANMPAHWDRRDDEEAHPALEAKLWAVGKVVSAQAAVGLLQARADSPIWPEFTEYGCFACHHNLQAPSWRQTRGYAGRKPGSLAWGTWNFALLPQLASELGGSDVLAPSGPFAALSAEMQKPFPDALIVTGQCRDLQAQLDRWAVRLAGRETNPEQLQKLLERVASDGHGWSLQNWDSAVQTYLAAVALYRGHAQLSAIERIAERDEAAERVFTAWRGLLAFPASHDSPQKFESDPKALGAQIEAFHQLLQSE